MPEPYDEAARKRVGEYVVAARQKHRPGMSRGAYAKELRVGLRRLGDVETGREWVGPDTRAQLANAFGWTPDSFRLIAEGGEPRLASDTEPQRYVASLPGLDDMTPEALRRLADEREAEDRRLARDAAKMRREYGRG